MAMKFDPTSPERKPRVVAFLVCLGAMIGSSLTVLAQPPSISGPESTCVEAAPFALATAPAGGVLMGPGIVDDLFDPSVAGEGVHTIDYIYDGALASWTLEVLAAFDATILTQGPFCADDEPVQLEAATTGGTWIGDGVFGEVFDPSFVSPGTANLTYELGEAGDGCYDADQQAIVVYPLPSTPTVELIQPLLDGTFHVVALGQPDVTYTWFDLTGELLATGDTLYNYEEEYVFEVVATNTYGCASSLSTNLVFPGTFDLVDMDIQWLNAHTVALNGSGAGLPVGCARPVAVVPNPRKKHSVSAAFATRGRMATGHVGTFWRRHGASEHRALMSALAVTLGHTLRLDPRNSPPRELCRTLRGP